ncbi:hypothetical protein OSTOST_12089, partial [Ostertagia ostertagi]
DSETVQSCSTCYVHGAVPARYAYSCENPSSHSFEQCYEDASRGLQCQSTQCCSEFCPTCHHRNMSTGLPNNFSSVTNSIGRQQFSKLENINIFHAQAKHSKSSSRESLPRTAEAISEECQRDSERTHNGRVLAYSLLLGLGCVLLSSIWALIRLLPVALIPIVYLNRNNLFGETPWLQDKKAAEDSTT